MSYRPLLVFLVGCASGGAPDGGPNNPAPDAPQQVDIDAPPDGPCIPTTTQLLANGNFDAAPEGSGWTQAPIDPAFPIITTDDGIAEDSPAEKAWMGGFAQANANDQMFQDVAVPPSTTMLVLSGKFAVATTETGAAAVDTASIQLVQPGNGAVIESIRSFDNTQTTTTWSPFDHTVGANVSGQTVRLLFRSSNSTTSHTNFFFDSFALTATHCQ
jgi:hypothetical protein